MNLEQARTYTKEYSRLLRAMKKHGVKVEDVPKHLQPLLLELHQNALWAQEILRTERKLRKGN